MINQRNTQRTRRRYQRISRVYNAMETLPELKYMVWRKMLWKRIHGPRVLEVGVGTGKNIPFYPQGMDISAIDLTLGMLTQARRVAAEEGVSAEIKLGDVQQLDWPDNTFDSVIATFVFCSVTDPALGLREIERVLKPGGQLFLLEHVRAKSRLFGLVMDLLNPIIVRMMGANINRRTIETVQNSPLELMGTLELSADGIFNFIFARKKAAQ